MRNTKHLFHKSLNWALTLILVILVMATPALADALSNSVGSPQIIDRSIRAIDIRAGAIVTKKIAGGAVRNGKLANSAVNSAKIANGSITNADIAAGAAIAASKINRSGLNADLLDGRDGSGYVAKTGDQTMGGKLTAANLSYGSAKTGYLSIPGNSFLPESSATGYDSGSWDMRATSGSGFFRAPVNLPDGATITAFDYTLLDNDGSGSGSVAQLIRRSATGTGTNNDIVTTAYSVDSPSYQTLSGAVDGSYKTVDNANYSYFAFIYLNSSAGPLMAANRIRITYTYTTPGS